MFDVTLFNQLNEEYRSRPLVAEPMQTDPASLEERARQRTRRMQRQLGVRPGQRLLEIGCGRGHLARRLARDCGVNVVGVDIEAYGAWDDLQDHRVTFVASDIADLGEEYSNLFDAAYSISVWEHLEHPAEALETAYRLLKPGGVLFLQAQLHPGPRASHCYRQVYFPWPHLLFEDEVFEDFYESIGMPRRKSAYLNRWTDLHYRFHADRIGFEPLWWSTPNPWFDEEFYERFQERLSPFPKWDLSHDAIIVRLRKPIEPKTESPASGSTGEKSFSGASVDRSLIPRARAAGRRVRHRVASALPRRR